MKTTYISELTTVKYPIREDQVIPFSNSVITGASVAITQPDTPLTGTVALRSINILSNMVIASVCLGNIVLGTITGILGGGCSFHKEPDTAGIDCTATISIGLISEEDVGVYDVVLQLDPTCVLLYNKRYVQRYSAVFIDKKEMAPTQVLNLNIGGQCTAVPVPIAANTISIKPDDPTTIDTYGNIDDGVTAINGQRVTTTNGTVGTTLVIKSTSEATVTITSGTITTPNLGKYDGGLRGLLVPCVSIAIDGGTAFPHCFGTVDHDNNITT